MFFRKEFWKCEDIKPVKHVVKNVRLRSQSRSKPIVTVSKNIKKRKSPLKQKNIEEQSQKQELSDQIVEEDPISLQQKSFLQLQCKIRQYRNQPMNQNQISSTIEFYFRNFIKIQKYQNVMKDIGIRSYNIISKYVLRKQFLPKIQGQISKIMNVVKFKFQTKQLLVVVKNKNKSNVQLQITEFNSFGKKQQMNKSQKLFNGKRVMTVAEYRRYSNIQNYLMVNFENNEIYTINEYLDKKADLSLLILVYRTRIKMRLKTYKYKSKFTLNYFYQNHINKKYPLKQIIFFAKIFLLNGTLKLSIQSISQAGLKFMVTIKPTDNYQSTLQDFLSTNHISLIRNKPFKIIPYHQFLPQINKIQSVFKGFHEFHSYQQYKLQHPEWCITKSDLFHTQFITCVTKQFYIVLAYQSNTRESLHTFKYKLKYTQIIKQQFLVIKFLESQYTFTSMIGRINNRIEAFEMNSNFDYKNRLEKLKQVLFRFLLMYKNRRSARINYHQTKRIQIDKQQLLIMVRNSPHIAQSYQISIYNLTRTKRQYSFTINKQICSKQIQNKQVQKLFYLSYNHCILKPLRIKDRHYVIELKQIAVDQENVYFYEVYQEKRSCFYLEVYKGNSSESYESVYRKEIQKRELAEMEIKDVEREVMEIIKKQTEREQKNNQ